MMICNQRLHFTPSPLMYGSFILLGGFEENLLVPYCCGCNLAQFFFFYLLKLFLPIGGPLSAHR